MEDSSTYSSLALVSDIWASSWAVWVSTLVMEVRRVDWLVRVVLYMGMWYTSFFSVSGMLMLMECVSCRGRGQSICINA